METKKHGNMDIETWTWRLGHDGHGEMDMEI
jgi:hypothetical protein